MKWSAEQYLFVVVWLALLSIVEAQNSTNIQFFMSYNANTVAGQQLRAGTELAFQHANLRSGLTGISGHNITLTFLDDGGNLTRLDANLRDIKALPPDQVAGLLYSSSSEHATRIQEALANTTIPFINPLSGSSALRTPFQRNIINIRPSYNSELYAIIKYFGEFLEVEKFVFLYGGNSTQTTAVVEFVEKYCNTIGVVVNTIRADDEPPSVIAPKVIASSPEAIIVWTEDSNFFYNYAYFFGNITNQVKFVSTYSINAQLTAARYNVSLYNFWSTNFLPVFLDFASEYSLVRDFQASTILAANLTGAQKGLLYSVFGYEAYYTGRWIEEVLFRGNNDVITGAEFLRLVYDSPGHEVGGWMTGPISDDCSPGALYECCNVAQHSFYLVNTNSSTRGALQVSLYLPRESVVSWSSCDVDPEGTLEPVLFGMIVDPNDSISNTLYYGIKLAFQELNSDKARQGVRPLKIVSAVITNETDAVNITKGFFDRNVTALVGYGSQDALDVESLLNETGVRLVAPISGSKNFRGSQKTSYINVRFSIKEVVISFLDFLMKKNGTTRQFNLGIYYDTNDIDGREWLETLNEAFESLGTYDYTTNKTAGFKNKVKLTLNFSSTDSLPTVSDLQGEDLHWVVLASSEPTEKLLNITRYLNSLRPDSAPFDVLYAGKGSGSIMILSSIIAKLPNPVASAYFPYESSPSGADSQSITLFADFGKARIDLASIIPEPALADESGAEGFLLGYVLAKVVSDVNGPIDNTTFRTSFFQGTSRLVKGVQVGPYGRQCNEGSRGLSVNQYREPFVIPVLNRSWTNCNVEFLSCGANCTVGEETQNYNTVVIISVVVVAVVVLGCCFIAALIVLASIVFFNPNAKKKRNLKEPNYKSLAISPKFLDRSNLDAMFIASTTSEASIKLSSAQILAKLEAIILEPSKVYPIIQALTKGGLAREEVTAAVVYIYYYNDSIDELLDYTISREIGNVKTETDLFKEDSVLVSIFVTYSKLVGLQYLWKVLADTLYDVTEVHSVGGRDSDSNRTFLDVLHLKLAAQSAFNKMKTTPFPAPLQRFLYKIKSNIGDQYHDLSNSVVSTFVLLRFICLAITNPKHYGLWKRQPSEKTLKFIVLLGKIIQNTAFGVEFNSDDEMAEVNDYVRVNTVPMSKWVENISMEEMEDEEDKGNDNYQKVEVGEGVRDNCVKWMYSVLWMNRQVVRRELDKKLNPEEQKEMKAELEDIGVMRMGGSSESLSASAMEERSSRSTEETNSSQ